MADGGKKRSILDDLKAGSTIVSDGGTGALESNAMDHGTGQEFEPADAFGSDPEIIARDDDDDFGDDLQIDDEPGSDGGSDAPRDSIGRDASKPRGAASPNYNRDAARAKRASQGNIGLIEHLLIGVHSGIAAMLQNPGWELGEDEAKKLAAAAAQVQAQYSLTLDPKTEAWVKLLGVAGQVYAPRLGVSLMMRRSVKAEPIQEATSAAPTPEDTGEPKRDVGLRRMSADEIVLPSQMYPPGYRGG